MGEHPASAEHPQRFQRTADLEEIPLGPRVGLYRSDMEKAIILNQAGTLLWQHLEHPRTASELIEHLVAAFPTVERHRVEEDVAAYLRALEGRAIIAPVGDAQ